MTDKSRIIVILLAYNAAATLEKFYRDFPKQLVDQIILLDDASKDDTFKIAQKLGIVSYQNKINLGYGGNLKKAIVIALMKGGEIIIDIHPDGEYKPNAISQSIQKVKEGAELVLGNRFYNSNYILRKSGMNKWKLIPIKILNLFDKLILGTNINDFHQGFRVYTKNLFEKINFEENSNNYLFSFEIIAQAIFQKVKISQVAVQTRYTGKKRGASLKNSIIYSIGTFKILVLFILAKTGQKIKIFQKPKKDLRSRIAEFFKEKFVSDA